MSSPLIHAAAGYIIYKQYAHKLSENKIFSIPVMFFWSVVFSLLPDFDAIIGVLKDDMHSYHNQMTNSLFVCLGASAMLAVLAHVITGKKFSQWFLLAFICLMGHIAIDYFTMSRGLKLFWPFTGRRFFPPFHVFYGLRWSEGVFARSHFITLANEAVVIAGGYVILLLVRCAKKAWQSKNKDLS
jgi:membrane-bound metal-dependent hydrolase YbcI (DUF457 family)